MSDSVAVVNSSEVETEKNDTKLTKEQLHYEKIQFELMTAQEKKWTAEGKDQRRLELLERKEQLAKEKLALKIQLAKAKGEKLTIGDIETHLVKLLKREPINTEPGSLLAPFPHDIRVYKPDLSDDVLLYQVRNNTAYPLGKMSAVSMLHQYMGDLQGSFEVYNAGAACCKRVMESWIYGEHKNSVLPHHWGTADSPDLCFNRQEFDLIPCTWQELHQAHPIITQMFDRLSNPDAVADWFGSLLVPDSYRKQSLYLWGKPGGGKSQYALLLKSWFGPAYCALSNKDLEDKFWRGDIEKCRVVVFKEANSDFINSDEYKDLTGDSDQRINRKFLNAHQAVIDTMFMFVSNHLPKLTGDEGVVDRLLMSEAASIPKGLQLPEDEVRRLLFAARGHAGGYFRQRFLERNPTKGKIIDTHAVEVTSCIVEKYPVIFEEIFEGNFMIVEGPLDPARDFILGIDFTTRLQSYGIVGKKDTLFREYVREKCPKTVEYKKHRPPRGESKKCWVGLRLKTRPSSYC